MPAAARDARAVRAGVPAGAYALAFSPAGEASADVVDHAGDFVYGHAGILNAREESFFCDAVAVANAASLHANAHVAGAWVWNFALDNFKIRYGFRHLYHFHLRH